MLTIRPQRFPGLRRLDRVDDAWIKRTIQQEEQLNSAFCRRQKEAVNGSFVDFFLLFQPMQSFLSTKVNRSISAFQSRELKHGPLK